MITQHELYKIAKLSKLHLSPQQAESLTDDMRQILAFADTVNAAVLETDAFESVHPLCNALREDEVSASLDREEVLRNADDNRNGYFCVLPPKEDPPCETKD